MTPQALKREIADLIDDFCVLNRTVSELREHNSYLESRVSEESDYATLLARHDALVEAVKWLLDAQSLVDEYIACPNWRRWIGISDIVKAARAEVDRLMGEVEG